MKRCPLALLIVSAAVAMAQPMLPPAKEAPAAAPAPAKPRAISPAVAELLKASLPKIAPVKPAAKKPESAAPELRETDQPQNEIVRLPNFVVRESKPPVFREQDIYTRQALARRLAQRYYSEGYLAFSKLVGYTPLSYVLPSAEASAMAQFRDEERLRQKHEFEDLTNMITDPAAGAKAKEVGRDTFLHWGDMGWQGGRPK